VRVAATEDVAQTGTAKNVHLPSPSYYPLVIGFSLPIIGYGLIFNFLICIPGAILLLWGVYGWVFEPADDPDVPHGHGNEHHGGDGDGDGHAELTAAGSSPTTGAVTEEAPVG
jgi:cytochrome c oxidase subunit 1